jgi:hypothetical protein
MTAVARLAFREYANEARTHRKFEGSDLAARRSEGERNGCGTASVTVSEMF